MAAALENSSPEEPFSLFVVDSSLDSSFPELSELSVSFLTATRSFKFWPNTKLEVELLAKLLAVVAFWLVPPNRSLLSLSLKLEPNAKNLGFISLLSLPSVILAFLLKLLSTSETSFSLTLLLSFFKKGLLSLAGSKTTLFDGLAFLATELSWDGLSKEGFNLQGLGTSIL